MPKIGNTEISGCLNFQGRPQFTQIATIKVYLPNEIKHNVHIQCQRNHIEVKKIDYCKVRNIGVLRFSELIQFSILANRNISV